MTENSCCRLHFNTRLPSRICKVNDVCDKMTIKWGKKAHTHREEALNVLGFQCGMVMSEFQTPPTAHLICFKICPPSPHTHCLGIQFIFGKLRYLNACLPAMKNSKNFIIHSQGKHKKIHIYPDGLECRALFVYPFFFPLYYLILCWIIVYW